MTLLAALILAAALQQETPERPAPFGELQEQPEPYFPDRLGPFSLESFSPLASFRSGFSLQAPSTLGRGMFEVHASQSWADVWALNEDDWRIDYEGVRTDIALAYGVSRSTTVSLKIDTMRRTTGKLDGFILKFHEAVGAEQAHRDNFPTNEIHLELPPENGEPGVDLQEEALDEWTQSVILGVERRMNLGRTTVLAFGVSLRRELENVDALDGGSPVDIALSAAVSREFGDFSAYLVLNVAWFGNEELAGLELRPVQPSALFALEWRCLPTFSLVLQYVLAGGVLEKLEPFNRPTSEVAFGFKWEIAPGMVVEAALLENLIIPDNSADFGARVGLSFRW